MFCGLVDAEDLSVSSLIDDCNEAFMLTDDRGKDLSVFWLVDSMEEDLSVLSLNVDGNESFMLTDDSDKDLSVLWLVDDDMKEFSVFWLVDEIDMKDLSVF